MSFPRGEIWAETVCAGAGMTVSDGDGAIRGRCGNGRVLAGLGIDGRLACIVIDWCGRVRGA